MKRRSFLKSGAFAVAGVAALGALGCDSEPEPEMDAGPPAEDAGPPAEDAGPPAEDAGPPAEDAGPPDEDAGVACTIADASGPSNSHGHMILIPAADLMAPADRSYTSTGGTHPHTVDLTAAELTTLASTCTVTVSSADTHPHTWVITIP